MQVAERRSVFRKLLAVMLTMAISLVLLVAGFFAFVVNPAAGTSVDQLLAERARTIVTVAQDPEEALRLAAGLGLDVRYEGTGGSLATTRDLPSLDEVREAGILGWHRGFHGRHYHVETAAAGGTYLFAWTVPSRLVDAHLYFLGGLLVVMGAVVWSAHVVLARLLQPLRALTDGVTKFGTGHLDVALAPPRADEFARLTDAFNEMAGRIREMIAARENLLVDVSHELRSPLTRLRVALELLPAGEQRTRMVTDIAEMDGLIGGLLELERLRGNGITRVRADLTALVQDVVRSFATCTPAARVAGASAPIFADVDAASIRIVLSNLIDNAIKYSLPDSRSVEVAVEERADGVVITVTDDGPGIPEADRARLFEPFFRVDRSRSKKTGGYGLGLSIAKRVVDAHRGTIVLKENMLRGVAVVVTLPRPR
jgi:signal transduction histidine kinase